MRLVGRQGRDGERGGALVVALVVLFSLLGLTFAALFGTTFDGKGSSNYQSGIQAQLAAASGLLHAQEVIDQTGVVNFQTDIVANWGSLFGTSSMALTGYPGLTYSVAAGNDATNPSTYMILTSTGRAPNASMRKVKGRLTLNGVFSPGAIYLPSNSVTANFNGNSFLIDGHDTNLDGTPNPNGDVPGIGTHTSAAQQSVVGALSNGQLDNITGLGGYPSVQVTNGFTTSQLDSFVSSILSQPGVVTNPTLVGNDTFGTQVVPQITHFSTSVTINGNLSGFGILIVDQGLTLTGSSTFSGLIIVKGTTQITTTSGNATILGALWTSDLQFTVGGSASITYSSQALGLVNGIISGGALPQHVKLVSWGES